MSNLPPIVMDARTLLSDRRVVAGQVVRIRNMKLVKLGTWLIVIGAKIAGLKFRLEKAD